jgi:predicted MFS family arabinose efflux permease
MPVAVTALSGTRLVALICAAQILVQIGAFFWPALLPGMIALWSLSNSEAGWITSVFYAAYMCSVPILVTLTDRIDAKFIYLFGVASTVAGHLLFAFYADGFWTALMTRALTGMGWAGTYMTGLKLLADQVDERLMSRAVTGHAASVGMSGALSYACADLIAGLGGWRLAFAAAALSAGVALLIVALAVPGGKKVPRPAAGGQALFDFRPVLRNRSAMAYAVAYCFHTLEMNALRGWGVAYLAFVAASTGASAALSPTTVLTALGLIGTLASVFGNEAAIRLGRRRLISLAMLASIVLAGATGLIGAMSYTVAVALLAAYSLVVWLDSSSLTAGTAGTADPSRRGATLAVHSMLGYGGGFVGPILVGWTLDLAGGGSNTGWAAAFLVVASLMLFALTTFAIMRPQGLAGDADRLSSRTGR